MFYGQNKILNFELLGVINGVISYQLDYPLMEIFIYQNTRTIVYAMTKKMVYGVYDEINGITIKNTIDIPASFPTAYQIYFDPNYKRVMLIF